VFAEIEPGLKTVSNPLTVGGAEKVKPRMAPGVGEHTVEVLRSLGYGDESIAELVTRGAAMDGTAKR